MQYCLEDILLLGNPLLYKTSKEVLQKELLGLIESMHGLAGLIVEYRKKHGAGRAIAAPQVGLMKRIIVMNIDKPVFMINPKLFDLSEERITLWDDCMSFPGLLVKVKRHKSCSISYRDQNWQEQLMNFEDDLSELIQHEYDHLDGILATQRAIDNKSFKIKLL